MSETILHADRALLPGGWARDVVLTVGADGRIAEVVTGAAPAPGSGLSRHDLLLPAPVNLHSHAFQRAMAGMAEARGPDPAEDFWTWRRLMYRFVDRLDPDRMEAIAALAFMEMAEAGFAAVTEFHYLHHGPDGTPYADRAEMAGRIAAAAQSAGLGLTLLPVFYQQAGCDGAAVQGGQRRFANTPDGYAALLDASAQALRALPADTGLGVAPHSLRAVSPDGLRAAVEMAQGRVVHMHIAEQEAEVAEVEATFGRRPVDWLLGQHDVGDRWCLIHCTHTTPAETRALAASGAIAGLCPITEANLGDGLFDGLRHDAAGGRFGIGTDSNIRIGLFRELELLEYGQRLRNRRRVCYAAPGASVGRRLFDAAREGGAAAGDRGAADLRAGAWADLMAIDTATHWFDGAEGDQLLDRLVFTAVPRDAISDVWSAGRHIVRGGRHIRRDRIVSDYRIAMAGLLAEL